MGRFVLECDACAIFADGCTDVLGDTVEVVVDDESAGPVLLLVF